MRCSTHKANSAQLQQSLNLEVALNLQGADWGWAGDRLRLLVEYASLLQPE